MEEGLARSISLLGVCLEVRGEGDLGIEIPRSPPLCPQTSLPKGVPSPTPAFTNYVFSPHYTPGDSRGSRETVARSRTQKNTDRCLCGGQSPVGAGAARALELTRECVRAGGLWGAGSGEPFQGPLGWVSRGCLTWKPTFLDLEQRQEQGLEGGKGPMLRVSRATSPPPSSFSLEHWAAPSRGAARPDLCLK